MIHLNRTFLPGQITISFLKKKKIKEKMSGFPTANAVKKIED